ncbi:MAG TPA: hypothetical protein VGB37_14640 [Candidatus Lokiarchaeia archaeon]
MLGYVAVLVTAVGGLVHLLQPFGFNILTWFGSISGWVQGITGLVTLITAWYGFQRMK